MGLNKLNVLGRDRNENRIDPARSENLRINLDWEGSIIRFFFDPKMRPHLPPITAWTLIGILPTCPNAWLNPIWARRGSIRKYWEKCFLGANLYGLWLVATRSGARLIRGYSPPRSRNSFRTSLLALLESLIDVTSRRHWISILDLATLQWHMGIPSAANWLATLPHATHL